MQFLTRVSTPSRSRFFFSAASAVLLFVLAPGGLARADEPPPSPMAQISAAFPVVAPGPAQYDVVQQVFDFPAGSALPDQSHGGTAFVTVVDGSITRRVGDTESAYNKGQSFTEKQGEFNLLGNKASTRARVMVSLLLSPGAPVTIDNPNAPAPAQRPTTVLNTQRITLTTQPAQFNLQQVVITGVPGTYTAEHTHGGPQIQTQIEGDVVIHTGGKDLTFKPGEPFADVGPAHDVRSVGTLPGTTVITQLRLPGAPVTIFTMPLAPVAAAPIPVISPPNTGDAGLLLSGSPVGR